MAGQNAAALLYSLHPQMVDLGVQSREGPPHDPYFTYAIAVGGYQFEGYGRSIKAAKNDACEKALGSLSDIERGLDVTDSDRGVQRYFHNPLLPLQEKLNTCFTWSDVQQVFGKSALMLLNQLFGSFVQWGEETPRGPAHARSFVVELSVKLGERMFRFSGHSSKRKDAKQVAAFSALKELADIEEESGLTNRRKDWKRAGNESQRVDDLALRMGELDLDIPERDSPSQGDAVDGARVQSLRSLIPGRQPNRRRPEVSRPQDDEQGWNDALKKLQFLDEKNTSPGREDKVVKDCSFSGLTLPAAAIAEAAVKKFEEHAALVPAPAAGRTMFAAVVLERGPSCRVVSLATGVMVVDGHRLRDDGTCVHDCHAPVVARRTFQRYLYQQVELALEESQQTSSRRLAGRHKEQSIFTVNRQGSIILCSDVKFHLFLSELPCGDAKRKVSLERGGEGEGHLHYKEETGTDAVPSLEEVEQSFVAVTSGRKRLRTMSCSDKLLIWTAVGMQGGLLSNLISPVYVESIVIGERIHRDHVERSLVGRLADLPLPPSFGRKTVAIAGGAWQHSSKKCPESAELSFNWADGDSDLELIKCATGKRVDDTPSRLCKRSMLSRLSDLRNNFQLSKGLPELGMSTTYRQAKDMCATYRRGKKVVLSFLESNGSSWVKKPEQVSSFHL